MTEWATSRHCLTPCATLKHRCRSKHSDRNVQVEALINTLPYTPPERKAKRLGNTFCKVEAEAVETKRLLGTLGDSESQKTN